MEIDIEKLRETSTAKQRELRKEALAKKKKEEERLKQIVTSSILRKISEIPGLLERAAQTGKTTASIDVGIGEGCREVAHGVVTHCRQYGLAATVRMSKFRGSDESPEHDNAFVDIDFSTEP